MADMFTGAAAPPVEGAEPKAIAGVPLEFRPRGLTDVKRQVRSIRWLVLLSTAALVVLTAVNLGMVVAGIHITRQFSLTTYPDGTVHLTKKGDGGRVVHVGQTYHENLPLSSRFSDSYYKKLDSVTLNYQLAPAAPAAGGALAAGYSPTPGELVEGVAGRRALKGLPPAIDWSNVTPNPGPHAFGSADPAPAKHTIHARVDGFQRLACADCASGTQVKLSTAYGSFIVRDEAVIPLLDTDHFPGLDVKAFRESAALGQGVPAQLVAKWNDSVGVEVEADQAPVDAPGGLAISPGVPAPEPLPIIEGEVDVPPSEQMPARQRRALQQGLFDGDHHGSWDATFNSVKDGAGSEAQTTFDANFHSTWTSSGGSNTDVAGHADWNFNDSSGHAQVGIKHEW